MCEDSAATGTSSQPLTGYYLILLPKLIDAMTKWEKGSCRKASRTTAIVFAKPGEAPVWHWQDRTVSHITSQPRKLCYLFRWQFLENDCESIQWMYHPSCPFPFHGSSTTWDTCPNFQQMPQLKHARPNHNAIQRIKTFSSVYSAYNQPSSTRTLKMRKRVQTPSRSFEQN